MVKTQKQKLNLTLFQYPHHAINNIIASTAKDIYGVNWSPRVVRFRPKEVSSSLQYIDYAVPCFDLAKKINTSPKVIANKISKSLHKYTDKECTAVLDNFCFEALSGYVNFQLQDGYFEKYLLLASEWFRTPSLVNLSRKDVKFLVYSSTFDTLPAQKTLYSAYSYLDKLYQLTKFDFSSTFVISDYSDTSIESIANKVTNDTKRKQNLITSYSLVRKEITDNSYTNKIISEATRKVSKECITVHRKRAAKLKINNHDIVLESSISKQVNIFLDGLKKQQAELNLIFDKETASIYFDNPNTPVALRSADGILHKSSFVLYLMDKALVDGQNLIILAPQTIHQFLKQFVANKLRGDATSDRAIVYFDPQVSSADIFEMETSKIKLKPHFNQLAMILQKNIDKSDTGNGMRYNLLSLADMPMELYDLVANNQLPAIYDLINQSNFTLGVLTDH